MRLGRPLKNHTCEQGEASSMWPRRSRRTLLSVTSTPHLSQITPRCFMRLYLPHRHSQSVTGPKIFAQNNPSRSEERRVGKEDRCRESSYNRKKKARENRLK